MEWKIKTLERDGEREGERERGKERGGEGDDYRYSSDLIKKAF